MLLGEEVHMTEARPTRAAKIYWALCAIISGVLTVLVNVAHGLGMVPAPHTVPAGIVAAIPPLMTIALFEGYFLAKRCAPQHVLRVVMGAVIVLGGASFSISYTSIAMFLNRQPGDLPAWTGWVMPALLDIFVVVSAYVYYVLAKHTAAPVVAKKRAQRSRFQRLADAATNRIEARLEVPETVQVSPAVEVREAPVEAPQRGIGSATEPSVDALVEPVAEAPTPSVEPSTEVSPPAAKSSVEPVAEELLPFMEEAARMLADGVVDRNRVSVEKVAAVIAAVASGMTDNRIKQAGLASASTASKVRAELGAKEEPLALTAAAL